MKKLIRLSMVACLGLLFAASTCLAQMYRVTDLGTFGGSQSDAFGINDSGQVVGWAFTSSNSLTHAFRTAPNSPINPATDDLGTLASASWNLVSADINASGQVAAYSWGFFTHAFRAAPHSPINPVADDLGTLGGPAAEALGINNSGQVVGWAFTSGIAAHAFRTAPNSPINPATDDLGTLGGGESWANGVNASGQAVGRSFTGGKVHAFRTAANSPINPATDDLGTLGGANSEALGINDSGQVVGWAIRSGDTDVHAFRTASNSAINPATDDLGTLGGTFSEALGINASGQVVGFAHTSSNDQHAFLYNSGVMHDLNNLIPPGVSCVLVKATHVNDAGQIAATGNCSGKPHAVLLSPVYKAFVRPPIKADGSSVFTALRGVLPVRFTLTQYDSPTCNLLSATIAVTRTAGGPLGPVDESAYSTNANNGSSFRIDACQYVYNLAASALGVGTYRVDISIDGIFIGHAVFALQQHD